MFNIRNLNPFSTHAKAVRSAKNYANNMDLGKLEDNPKLLAEIGSRELQCLKGKDFTEVCKELDDRKIDLEDSKEIFERAKGNWNFAKRNAPPFYYKKSFLTWVLILVSLTEAAGIAYAFESVLPGTLTRLGFALVYVLLQTTLGYKFLEACTEKIEVEGQNEHQRVMDQRKKHSNRTFRRIGYGIGLLVAATVISVLRSNALTQETGSYDWFMFFAFMLMGLIPGAVGGILETLMDSPSSKEHNRIKQLKDEMTEAKKKFGRLNYKVNKLTKLKESMVLYLSVFAKTLLLEIHRYRRDLQQTRDYRPGRKTV